MPDKPQKPVDRRAFFRQLMLGALNKAESSSKQVGATIADALRAAQAATEKKRLEEEAKKPRTSAPHPVAKDAPLIRRPDNRISHGSLDNAADTTHDPITPPTQPQNHAPHETHGQRSTRILRPPGALTEEAFQSTCSRCGECARVCPASCILLDSDDDNSATSAGTLPHIIARESACTACASVACTNACPTGALIPLSHISQISLGLAIVNHATCVRTPTPSSPGKDCRQCIAPCPIGESAIGIDHHGQIQIRPGCIGCGLCEQSCPTDPTSIYIDSSLGPEYPVSQA